MTPTALAEELRGDSPPLLLDIREEEEREISKFDGDVWIPMHEIPTRRDELDPERNIVIYCRSGNRSGKVVAFLRRYGYNSIRNLATGINGWAETVDPTVTQY